MEKKQKQFFCLNKDRQNKKKQLYMYMKSGKKKRGRKNLREKTKEVASKIYRINTKVQKQLFSVRFFFIWIDRRIFNLVNLCVCIIVCNVCVCVQCMRVFMCMCAAFRQTFFPTLISSHQFPLQRQNVIRITSFFFIGGQFI